MCKTSIWTHHICRWHFFTPLILSLRLTETQSISTIAGISWHSLLSLVCCASLRKSPRSRGLTLKTSTRPALCSLWTRSSTVAISWANGRRSQVGAAKTSAVIGCWCSASVCVAPFLCWKSWYQHRSALVWCPAVGRKAGDQLWRRRIPDFVHARCNRRISPTGKSDLLVIFMIVCCGLIWCILEYIGILRWSTGVGLCGGSYKQRGCLVKR